MHSGGEQTNLWEQSDLLDLVAAAETRAPAPSTRVATGEPDQLQPAQPPGSQQRDNGSSDAETHQPSSKSCSAESAGAAASQASAASQPITPNLADSPRASAAQTEAGGRAAGPEGEPTAERAPAAAAARRDPVDREPAAGLPSPVALPCCPQRLLILDTETTALSPEQGQCIEVGAVLFDVGSRAVLMQVSFLLPCERNPAQAVNGIPADVSRLSQPWQSGLGCFEAMVKAADALLAHNASFDRQWFGHGELPALEKPWICSMEDIRWPAERQLRATPSVRDLALAYGVPVWAAHRALTDCIYLVQVFQRCEDLEALLQAALEPRRLVRARLSYDQRQLAKEAGFRWNEPVAKAWSRRLSEREIAALPFAVDPVEPDQRETAPASPDASRWRRSA